MTPLILASLAAALLASLSYAALCAAQPFGDCRKCKGLGFKTHTDRKGCIKRGRDCRRCRGIGKRIRVGRHFYNLAHRTWRAGSR